MKTVKMKTPMSDEALLEKRPSFNTFVNIYVHK